MNIDLTKGFKLRPAQWSDIEPVVFEKEYRPGRDPEE